MGLEEVIGLIEVDICHERHHPLQQPGHLHLRLTLTGVPRSQESADPWDPTVGPCRGPYEVSWGVRGLL